MATNNNNNDSSDTATTTTNTITIRISKETYDRLARMGNLHDSFDSVIKRLIENFTIKNNNNNGVKK